MTGLDELQARSGSYVDFLDALRQYRAPEGTAAELFARIAFNMAISNDRSGARRNNFADLLAARSYYGLTQAQASGIIERVQDAIRTNWTDAADYARLTRADRELLWGETVPQPRNPVRLRMSAGPSRLIVR